MPPQAHKKDNNLAIQPQVLPMTQLQIDSELNTNVNSPVKLFENQAEGQVKMKAFDLIITERKDSCQDLEVTMQPNICFLTTYTATMFAATMNFGFVLAAVSFCWGALKAQYGSDWTEEQAGDYLSLINTSGIFGMAVGGIGSGYFIESGGWRLMVFGQVVALVASCLSMILSFGVQCFARLLFGIGAGVTLAVGPRMLEETIPGKLMGYFGVSTNLSINTAITFASFVAYSLPSLYDVEALSKTGNWRLVLALPFPFIAASLLMLFTRHNSESLAQLIKLGDKEGVKNMLENIYPNESQTKRDELQKSMDDKLKNSVMAELQISMYESMTKKRHRVSTMFCITLAFLNQFTGINVVMIYMTLIFESANKTASKPVDIQVANSIIGFTGVVSALLSIAVWGRNLNRRPIFIIGHVVMGAAYLLSFYLATESEPVGVLAMLSLFIIGFNTTQGPGYFSYIAEVGTNAANGICVFVQSACSILISASTPKLLSIDSYGISGILLTLGIFQFFSMTVIAVWMEETNGLSLEIKQELYSPGPDKKQSCIADS